MKSPILFLVFNRPETTSRVFESIRRAEPPRLYIAADGPRKDKPNDDILCNQVKSIVSNITWKCEVKHLYREFNLGCKKAVSEAISWFFEQEEEGIIVEDDVLPLQSFYDYCDELLEKYRNNQQIGVITGNNLISKRFISDHSYFFSHYANIWGWASWRRVWINYDVDLSDWPKLKNTKLFKNLSDNTPYFSAYWKDQIQAIYDRKMDTWDFQFFLTCWKANSLCIVPKENLVYNLGFGEFATHTTGQIPQCVVESEPTEISFPLKHPNVVKRSVEADKLVNSNVFQISLFTIIKWKIRRLPIFGDMLSHVKKRIKREGF